MTEIEDLPDDCLVAEIETALGVIRLSDILTPLGRLEIARQLAAACYPELVEMIQEVEGQAEEKDEEIAEMKLEADQHTDDIDEYHKQIATLEEKLESEIALAYKKGYEEGEADTAVEPKILTRSENKLQQGGFEKTPSDELCWRCGCPDLTEDGACGCEDPPPTDKQLGAEA